MKKQRSRELLLNTKAAQKWEQLFDVRVDELMELVNKIDTISQVKRATEVIDVYNKKKKAAKRPRSTESRPFEFLVYHN